MMYDARQEVYSQDRPSKSRKEDVVSVSIQLLLMLSMYGMIRR